MSGTDLIRRIIINETPYHYTNSKNPWDYRFEDAINDAEAHSSKFYYPLINEIDHSPLENTCKLPVIAKAMGELELEAMTLFEKKKKEMKEQREIIKIIPEKEYFPLKDLLPAY